MSSYSENNLPLSKILFYSCLAFWVGLVCSPYLPSYFLVGFLILPFLKRKKLALVLALSFSIGLVYYQLRLPNSFHLTNFENEQITLEGRVVEEDRDVVSVNKFRGQDLDEKVIIYSPADLKHGEIVQLKGTPLRPGEKFRDYFHKDGIGVSFFEPDVAVVGESYGFRSYLFQVRRQLEKKISQGLPFPHSSVYKAVLLGNREDISESWEERFSKSGVAHLLAISGTHIVIISGLLVSLGQLFGFKKGKYIFASMLLLLFVLLVGAPTSAIRASLMGLLLFLSKAVHRERSSFRSLIFVGTGMLIVNPLLILKDVGFQLSFAAAAGIILFSPKIKKFLTTPPEKTNLIQSFRAKLANLFSKSKFITESLSVTLSAQTFALPLVAIHFGFLPFLAPISNLFLAPLLPVIMLSGLLSLFLSFLLPATFAFSFSLVVMKIVLLLVKGFYSLCFIC